VTRHDPAVLDEITAVAEKWLRRCNGQPAEGILIDRATLRAVLAASAAVRVGPGGVVSWRSDGRGFTAEPVRDEPTA
jgi:hypothetical protein